MMMSARNRNPFTATQWQELEQQALIFKYMASGMPIPPHLIFPIKTSLDHSALPSTLFPHQPMDWGCFQMGFGRNVDPEPGRCRRTDGKKWRCSKEAYPDSKYCERHMHRGRNRSRKPVEVNTTLTTTNSSIPITSFNNRIPSTTTTTNNNINPSSYSHSSSTSFEKHNHPNNDTPLHTFLYPHSSQNNSTHLVLDSGSYSHSQDQENHREEVDERAFFSEPSGTLRSLPESTLKDPWRLTPLRMSSCSSSQSSYSQFHLKQKQQQEQQCFVLGTDLKATSDKEESQQPLRHFFDEWPPKSKDSWLGLDRDRSDHSSHSTTQLSMSLPWCSKDFLK